MMEDLKKSSMTFDFEDSEVYATLHQIEDLYVHVGTKDEFHDFIHETEDLSNYVLDKYKEWDGDSMQTEKIYHDDMMDDFHNPIYYALFYDYQKKLGLTAIRKMALEG